MNANNKPALDEKTRIAQSILQTIKTALPSLPPQSPASSDATAADDEDRDYRTGKVARLPAAIRENVNLMLNDGAPYAAVIDKLASLGHSGFTPSNISRWKQGGYVDWLNRRYQADATSTATAANLQLLKDLSVKEQQPIDKIIELVLAHHILGVCAGFNPLGMHSKTAADILAILGNTVCRHVRERTRSERLRLAVRRFETTQIDEKNPPATGANSRQ